jgi:hypothetical protein
MHLFHPFLLRNKLIFPLLAFVFFNSCEKTVGTVSVQNLSIWNEAPHNAFTDLIKYNNCYYCVFREGSAHESFDAKLHVVRSIDGKTWKSFAVISSPKIDFRDPHFFVDDNNNLSIGTNTINLNYERQNVIYKLHDSMFIRVDMSSSSDYWFWSYTKQKQTVYSIGYNMKQICFSNANSSKPKIALFESKDRECTNFDSLEANNFPPSSFGCPSESSMLFMNDSVLIAVVRDERTPGESHLGIAKKPFTNWQWQTMPFFLRGPKLALLPDGRIFLAAASMGYYEKMYYAILNPNTFSVEDIKALPSAGDTGYPGVVIEGNSVLMSYYSSHEGNARVYIARFNY